MSTMSLHKLTTEDYESIKTKILEGLNATTVLKEAGKLIQFEEADFSRPTQDEDGQYVHTLDVIERIFDNFTVNELNALEKSNTTWYEDLCKLNVGYHPTSYKILKSFKVKY